MRRFALDPTADLRVQPVSGIIIGRREARRRLPERKPCVDQAATERSTQEPFFPSRTHALPVAGDHRVRQLTLVAAGATASAPTAHAAGATASHGATCPGSAHPGPRTT